MKSLFSLLVIAVVSFTSYAQSLTDKIKALNAAMEQEFNANDMEKVSAFYLDSALIIGGGANTSGRKEIDNYWMSLKDKSTTWKLEIDKVEDHGEIVIQRGRSYLTFASGGKSNVRFILVWKKMGESYRILSDTFFRM